MALWKKIAIGFGVIAVLGGLGGAAAFMLTAGADKAATAFVEEIAQRGPDAAYRDAAPALRLGQDAQAFSAQVRQWRLNDAVGANWPSRRLQNGRITLVGTVTLRSGENLPLRVDLIKAGKTWAVSGIALDAGARDSSD